MHNLLKLFLIITQLLFSPLTSWVRKNGEDSRVALMALSLLRYFFCTKKNIKKWNVLPVTDLARQLKFKSRCLSVWQQACIIEPIKNHTVMYYLVLENIHNSPKDGYLRCAPLSTGNFQFSFILSLYKFGYWDQPPPSNFRWPSLVWVGIFSRPAC